MIMVKGSNLEFALIRAHHANYNRSFDDLSKIDSRMWHVINRLMDDCSDAERANILSNIDNDWRNAMIPVEFIMFHEHRQMQPCEKHVRVKIGEGFDTIADLTLDDWNHLESLWVAFERFRNEEG